MIHTVLAIRMIENAPADTTPQGWADLLMLITNGDREAAADIAREAIKIVQSNRSTKENDMSSKETKGTQQASTKDEAPIEQLVGTRSPLAKIVPIDEGRIDLFNPMKWTKEDVETIKHTVCPKGIPDSEFKLFIMKCQASGMNPLLGEAFCVERNVKVGGTKDNPIWAKAFVFTPGEQGMEGRADDFSDYKGLRAAVVCAKDKIVIDPSTGEVSHQYNPAEDRGRILGAWAIAYREGRMTPVEYVRFEEYVDTRNAKWLSSPHTMIVKCARAAALRRAYPNKFDGIFAREEIRDDVDESQTPAQAEQANRDTTDKLADRMRQTAAAQADLKNDASRPGANSVPASQATVDVVPDKPKGEAPKTILGIAELKADLRRYEIPYDAVQLEKSEPYAAEMAGKVAQAKVAAEAKKSEKKLDPGVATPPVDPNHRDHATTEKLQHQAADEKKAAAAAQGPLMNFGPKKGQPVSSLEGPELLEMIALGESKIGTLAPEKAAKVRACIDGIKAEQRKRDSALIADAEPGSDFDVD